jgi:hypothetical protein
MPLIQLDEFLLDGQAPAEALEALEAGSRGQTRWRIAMERPGGQRDAAMPWRFLRQNLKDI